MVDLSALAARFRELYAAEPRLFRAPGRVNLIGEHTDYNDGFVFPMALDRGMVAAAAARPGRRVRVHSVTFGETVEFDLDRPGPKCRGGWIDYVEGMAQALLETGVSIGGADLALASDLSVGGGLSSSAALEISVGLALTAVSGTPVDSRTLALAGQRAEHTYVGMNCGIMDQFIATMGMAGHALLIDCRALEGVLFPLALGDAAVVVCDSRVRHTLASSEYNARRAECERGVALLRETIPGILALRDVRLEEFRREEVRLPEPVRRRCRHVISENERTLAAARALEQGDIAAMGLLMNASHDSLRRDYEVSCRELDILVESARAVPGVLGARMTGGGFGGCTVNLVRRDALDAFHRRVSRDYLAAAGGEAAIFTVEPGSGAAEVFP
jgi:galactokinase